MLNIITVYRFGSLEELDLTVSSMLTQVDKGFKVLFVLSNANEKHVHWLTQRLQDQISYKSIVNEDNSLYNAMNIALRLIEDGTIYFLNGGDAFYNSRSVSVINQIDVRNQPALFATLQSYKSQYYLRRPSQKFPAHQGFVVSRELIGSLEFNESLSIAADHYWMTHILSKHGCLTSAEVISQFTLGGISNYPSRKSVYARFKTQGIFRASKELLKVALLTVLGASLYYRLILGAPVKVNFLKDA